MQRLAFPVLSLLVIVVASGCKGSSSDTSALEAKIAALEERVASLESRLAGVQTQVTTATTTLNDASPAIAWAQGVQQYVSVDSRGDVVVAGANLRVQNVPGETPPPSPAVNGKGNLIVGFDEDRRAGTCTGGGNDGLACDPDLVADCPDGTCTNPQVVSEKSGSHNVIIGSKHTYTKDASLLVGFAHAATASSVFIAGARNSVAGVASSILGGADNVVPSTGFESVICGGKANSAGGVYAAVVGGQTNSAAGIYSSILGGTGNATTALGSYGVVLGGQSNTASTPYAIVP